MAISSKPDRDPAQTKPNPDHDLYAAGIYQAIACRLYCRYVDARAHAVFRGQDLAGAEPLITSAEAGRRYERAIEEWINETPSTSDAVLALVELIGVIAADRIIGEALRESGPVSEETDAYHQVLATAGIGEWLNQIVTKEWLDRRNAAYGPTGMPPKGREART